IRGDLGLRELPDSEQVVSEPQKDYPYNVVQATKEPGFLIKNFVADIDPKGLKARQKRRAGRRAKIKLRSLKKLKKHLQQLEEPGFQTRDYVENGYISRGSLMTDGLGLYLSVFKLKELQSVRYRRLPDDRLPLRIVSTAGGTDYYLQEIRNVIRTEEDIEQLWPGVNPSDIKILTLDFGNGVSSPTTSGSRREHHQVLGGT
ncbi:hypothetical protein BGZ54_005064, partial [Gamsiella multidivaricata]